MNKPTKVDEITGDLQFHGSFSLSLRKITRYLNEVNKDYTDYYALGWCKW